MNGDGFKDVIVGERNGFVNYYERMRDGSLKAGVKIKANGGDIKVTNNSAPEIVDWNADGLLDLLLGGHPESEGIKLYLNSGTNTEFKFTTSTKITVGGAPFSETYPYIQAIDFNKDGKKDLVVSYGCEPSVYVYFYENTGTNSAPVLAKGVKLLKKDNTPVVGSVGIQFYLGDWNGDNVHDMIWTETPPKNNIHIYLGEGGTGLIPQDQAVQPTGNKGAVVRSVKKMMSLECAVAYDQHIALSIYSPSGRLVVQKQSELLKAGNQTVRIDLSAVPPGFYCLRYTCNQRTVHQGLCIFR